MESTWCDRVSADPAPPSFLLHSSSDRILPTHKSRLAVQVKDADDGSSQNRGISSDKTHRAEGRAEKSCVSEVDNCLNCLLLNCLNTVSS